MKKTLLSVISIFIFFAISHADTLIWNVDIGNAVVGTITNDRIDKTALINNTVFSYQSIRKGMTDKPASIIDTMGPIQFLYLDPGDVVYIYNLNARIVATLNTPPFEWYGIIGTNNDGSGQVEDGAYIYQVVSSTGGVVASGQVAVVLSTTTQ